jgi:hypothetical protein
VIFAVLLAVGAPPVVRAHVEAQGAGAGGGGAGAGGWPGAAAAGVPVRTPEQAADALVAAADPEELEELCEAE